MLSAKHERRVTQLHLKATQDTGKCRNSPLQGEAGASWLTVARLLRVDSVAPPAHIQGPGNRTIPVIMVNCKAPTMTTERQIDLFLVVVTVLPVRG